LVEESRTNVQWFDSLSSVLSSASADGPTGNSANVYERAATNETAQITVQTIWTQNNGMVLSFFVKKQGNGRYFKVHPQGQLFGNAKWTYDYDTKTIVENNLFSFSVDELPNGWHRIKVVSSPVVRSTAHTLGISVHSALPTSGTNLDTGLLYGIQLEEGSFPTSYIPTTGTALTRSADVASITGSNFSSWYNQSEGAVYTKSKKLNPTVTSHLFSFNNGGVSNRILQAPSGFAFLITNSGVIQVNNSSTAWESGTFVESAIGFKVNDFALVTQGSVAATDNLGTIPTVTTLDIGNNHVPNDPFNGHISRLTYWPDRLADSTLQAITAS